MKIVIEKAVQALGINACLAVFHGATVSNRSNPLERKKKEACPAICAVNVEEHPFLKAYRELHRVVGVAEDVVPPGQHLVRLVQSTGRLPNINTVVDTYNLVSALTGLSVGAHDLAYLRGDLRISITKGTERYTPLGSEEPVYVGAGEYACLDEEKIICRLDVKQCRETRITRNTSSFLVYVQGNPATTSEMLLAGLRRIGDLVTEICGGEYTIMPTETD